MWGRKRKPCRLFIGDKRRLPMAVRRGEGRLGHGGSDLEKGSTVPASSIHWLARAACTRGGCSGVGQRKRRFTARRRLAVVSKMAAAAGGPRAIAPCRGQQRTHRRERRKEAASAGPAQLGYAPTGPWPEKKKSGGRESKRNGLNRGKFGLDE